MEPAAILIAAFNVEIRGPSQIVSGGEHCQVARSGIEPDVQDVGFLAELGAAALGAGHAGRQQFGCGALIPDVGGVLGEDSRLKVGSSTRSSADLAGNRQVT